jgi:hypothetical protein
VVAVLIWACLSDDGRRRFASLKHIGEKTEKACSSARRRLAIRPLRTFWR